MKYVLSGLIGFALGCLTLIGVSIVQRPDYTEVIECAVMSHGNQAALGEVYVLHVNGTKSIKIQADQCVNMESVDTGDKFKAIAVRDDEQTLQCIVRVGN